MQIDLALEHLALGNVPAERVSLLDMEQDEDSSRRYKRNAERFAKKEANVNNLMIRLEELSEAMRQFHFSMDEIRASTAAAVGSEGMPTKSAPVIESAAGIVSSGSKKPLQRISTVALPAGRPR
ncbi:hypothetical protein HDU87_003148 [Geranomyces variabilis]|uniref:Uncharacterized protein n=1 Tax=Geranomyces variabilis TaxID=109894 RepID=A0AAD5XMX4_9FUNG|nr:hypothetical protein HDU87_003148 [Geranomyces variabilis]